MTTANEYRQQEAEAADERHAPIIDAYKRGLTHAEIAVEVGVTRSRVTQILCRARDRGLLEIDNARSS